MGFGLRAEGCGFRAARLSLKHLEEVKASIRIRKSRGHRRWKYRTGYMEGPLEGTLNLIPLYTPYIPYIIRVCLSRPFSPLNLASRQHGQGETSPSPKQTSATTELMPRTPRS